MAVVSRSRSSVSEGICWSRAAWKSSSKRTPSVSTKSNPCGSERSPSSTRDQWCQRSGLRTVDLWWVAGSAAQRIPLTGTRVTHQSLPGLRKASDPDTLRYGKGNSHLLRALNGVACFSTSIGHAILELCDFRELSGTRSLTGASQAECLPDLYGVCRSDYGVRSSGDVPFFSWR